MKILRLALPAALLLIAFSAISFAQDVNTDYDHNVSFAQFHTYEWAKIQTEDPLWQSRIRDAVDKELERKGWQRVDSGGQVALTAVGATQNQKEYQTFYDNMGPGWGWGGFGSTATTTTTNYRVGTLVVDAYDAQSKHLIWRGTATDTLSGNPDKNIQKLDKAVGKMFDHFPPK